jgi:anti-sigma B factor antagonist
LPIDNAQDRTEIHVQPLHFQSIPAGPDCAVLQVTGEIDAYAAPQMREHVIKMLANGNRHIIADLRGVDFLDSTGLGVLVGSLKRIHELDGSLALVATAKKILTIFRVTGLIRVFALYSSPADVIGSDPHWQEALAREGSSAEEWCREHDLQ